LSPARRSFEARQWLVRVVAAIAGLLGFVFGYQFGNLVAGLWLGVITGLNGAIFATILVGALVDRLTRVRD
jgi:hypothetical protein